MGTQSMVGQRVTPRVKHIGIALILVAAGVTANKLLARSAVFLPASPLVQFTTSRILAGVGLVAVGAAFLYRTGRDATFIDLRRPTRWDLGYLIGSLLLLFISFIVYIATIAAFGLPTASNSIYEYPGLSERTIYLLLIPFGLFLAGPTEELLFRGVVQKLLYDEFSRPAAVLIASVLFALAHAPTYYLTTPDLLAVAVTLCDLFVVALILGGVYSRTENLLVPILAHGVYIAVLVSLLLL